MDSLDSFSIQNVKVYMERLWDVLAGEYPPSPPREIPIVASLCFYALTVSAGRVLRGAMRAGLGARYPRAVPYALDAVTTFQLMACSLENSQIFRYYGSVAYVGVMFVMGMWSYVTIAGQASSNPCAHVIRLVQGKTSLPQACLHVLCQLSGGLLSFSYARIFWYFELTDGHAGRYRSLHCTADLTVPTSLGFLIEFGATFVDALLCLTTFTPFLFYEVASKCLLGCFMVIAGRELTGMYMNPINATNQTFGCRGISVVQHIVVYWLSVILAGALAVMVHAQLGRYRNGRKVEAERAELDSKGEREGARVELNNKGEKEGARAELNNQRESEGKRAEVNNKGEKEGKRSEAKREAEEKRAEQKSQGEREGVRVEAKEREEEREQEGSCATRERVEGADTTREQAKEASTIRQRVKQDRTQQPSTSTTRIPTPTTTIPTTTTTTTTTLDPPPLAEEILHQLEDMVIKAEAAEVTEDVIFQTAERTYLRGESFDATAISHCPLKQRSEDVMDEDEDVVAPKRKEDVMTSKHKEDMNSRHKDGIGAISKHSKHYLKHQTNSTNMNGQHNNSNTNNTNLCTLNNRLNNEDVMNANVTSTGIKNHETFRDDLENAFDTMRRLERMHNFHNTTFKTVDGDDEDGTEATTKGATSTTSSAAAAVAAVSQTLPSPTDANNLMPENSRHRKRTKSASSRLPVPASVNAGQQPQRKRSTSRSRIPVFRDGSKSRRSRLKSE